MKKVIHKADTRGHSQYDWLDSYHTFSFDEYFDSDRINFGALRVLNDDKIAPGEGFQTHPHKNMEIITIPLKGHLQHGDSKKNSRIITVGEIQTMSAGTGIFHSEMNASPVEPVEILQIWIMPKERNTHPVYKDFSIKELERPNELAVIVSPDGSTPASLLQDTWFSIGKVEAGKKLGYHMHQSHGGVYIFLIEGEIAVDGEVLKRRDGMGVYDTKSFELETLKDSHILLIEVPMSPEGRPSTRTVLLKGLHDGKFIFYTNYESRKGKHLAQNPYISLSFVWHELERQVHIEGVATKVPSEESDEYFRKRPYKSRIGARISPQSQPIASRMQLIRAFVREAARWIGKEVERPDNWGGYAVTPTRMEFWQGRPNRLHDRFLYTLKTDGKWEINRLSP